MHPHPRPHNPTHTTQTYPPPKRKTRILSELTNENPGEPGVRDMGMGRTEHRGCENEQVGTCDAVRTGRVASVGRASGVVCSAGMFQACSPKAHRNNVTSDTACGFRADEAAAALVDEAADDGRGR
jgi:hypothetical protein